MRRYIHKLREKPEHKRKQIAFASASIFTAGILVVWVAIFSNKLSSLLPEQTGDDNYVRGAAAVGLTSQLDSLQNALGQGFDSYDSLNQDANADQGVNSDVSNQVLITAPTQESNITADEFLVDELTQPKDISEMSIDEINARVNANR